MLSRGFNADRDGQPPGAVAGHGGPAPVRLCVNVPARMRTKSPATTHRRNPSTAAVLASR